MLIEKLSSNNRHQFIDFFKRNDIDSTRKNFHPFEFSEEALEKEFSSINQDLFFGVFSENNKMIGFGMLRGWDEGYKIPSLGVLVATDVRGCGVGGQLVEYLVDVVKGSDSNELRLSVYEDNTVAMNIYHKCGFRVTEKQEVFGRTKWIMYCDVT